MSAFSIDHCRAEEFVPQNQHSAQISNPSINSNSNFKALPLRYMESFLRFTYFVGVCPHEYETDQHGCYKARRKWFQTVIGSIYVILTFLVQIFGLRQVKRTTNYEKKQLDPITYFTMAREIGLLFYAVAILHTFWFNAKDICNFLNLAARFGNKPDKNGIKVVSDGNPCSKSKPNWLIRNQVALSVIGCGVYTILSLTTFVIGGIGDRFSWDWDQLLQGLAQEGRGLLFLPMTEINPNSTLTSDLSTIDVAFVILSGVAYFAEDVYVCMGDTSLVICALLSFVCVQEFARKLNKISTDNDMGKKSMNGCMTHSEGPPLPRPNFYFVDILEEFDLIVKILNGLNQVIGLLVFGLTLASLPFFVNDFLNLLNPPSTMVLLGVLLYFIHLMVVIMLAAKVNKKAQALETWMSQRENYTLVKRSGASLGVEEMIAIQQGRNVGISVAGFFVITFGFVGSWISLLLTFVIVMLEFRSS